MWKTYPGMAVDSWSAVMRSFKQNDITLPFARAAEFRVHHEVSLSVCLFERVVRAGYDLRPARVTSCFKRVTPPPRPVAEATG